jgi:hypothetical protein
MPARQRTYLLVDPPVADFSAGPGIQHRNQGRGDGTANASVVGQRSRCSESKPYRSIRSTNAWRFSTSQSFWLRCSALTDRHESNEDESTADPLTGLGPLEQESGSTPKGVN